MNAALRLLAGLARNNEWANRRLHAACARLPRDAYRAERTGFFPSLRLTLNHILLVDRYYVDCLAEAGDPLSHYEAFARGVAFDELAALTAAQAESDARLVDFCAGLDGAALARRVVTPRPGGRPEERIDALLLHLFQHQIHHRGQAHAMISGTGVAPPQLDEFFLDQDAAARAAG